MTAGRSFVAAGIVGVMVWALKRELEYHEGQGGDAALLKSNFVPGRVAEPKSSDRGQMISAALNLFSNFNLGERQPTGEQAGQALGTRYAPARGGTGGITNLLGLIRSKEAPRGYDDYYRGSKIPPPRRLTTMTIREVLDWQDKSVAAGSASSAAGGYQIIRKTLRGLVGKGHARLDEKFSPKVQDRLALALLNQRGLQSYRDGYLSSEQFANNVAKEWASFPVVTGAKKGRSYYAGDGLNQALIGVDAVMNAVRAI